MSHETVRPTSISGIKRLARALRASQNIRLHEALDIAARRADFQDFAQANKALCGNHSGPVPQSYFAYISQRWRDRRTKTFGNECIKIGLSQPLAELVNPHQLVGSLSGMRFQDTYSLESISIPPDQQSTARWMACCVARTLQFMDITGLKPSSKTFHIWPRNDIGNRIPGCDHPHVWYDPRTKQHLITDEPYADPARVHASREEWCDRWNYEMVKPEWAGMHNPGRSRGTILFLLAKRSARLPLEEWSRILKDAAKPILDADWEEDTEHLERQVSLTSAGWKMVSSKPWVPSHRL